MPPRNRLAALKLIGRIKQHELESIGAELSALRAAQSDLDRQSADLSQRAATEASQSTADTRPYLPGYLKSVDVKQRGLEEERAKIEEQAALTEARLFTAFRETKTNETVLDRAVKEQSQEEARAEIAALDDAGRNLFLLKRGETQG